MRIKCIFRQTQIRGVHHQQNSLKKFQKDALKVEADVSDRRSKIQERMVCKKKKGKHEGKYKLRWAV